ncbi:MAG TPA: hypothetical protein VNV13_01960 [Steroidobacteraceae bacterium]|jgi:hypothetical protein|nr:hypothetical protein [Steroidobacteraceae bacterium]
MTAKQHITKFAGLGTNRVAGLQSRKLQRLQGSFGAANRGRRIVDPDEIRRIHNQLRQEGKIQ